MTPINVAIIKRKPGEQILIGDDIVVEIEQVSQRQVSVRVEVYEKHRRILRRELLTGKT